MSSEPAREDDCLALYVNFPLSRAIRLAPADSEWAAIVLRLAAEQLRQRKPLPIELADYLADAFETSMSKAPGARAQQLALELHLKALNKRPSAVGWIDVYPIMEANSDIPHAQLVRVVQTRLKVAKSLATRLVKQARSAKLEHERAMLENGGGE